MAAAGETLIGISFEFRAANAKEEGAPIDIIVPEEGIGWEMEATAIIEGHRQARRGQDARRLVGHQGSQRDVQRRLRGGRDPGRSPSRSRTCPRTSQEKMIKNDFEWAANNRERILAEWPKRYDAQDRAEELSGFGSGRGVPARRPRLRAGGDDAT